MRPRVYALGIWLVFSAVGALGSTGSTARQDLLAAAARGDGNALRLLTAGGDGTSSSTDGDDGGNPATLCRALLVASRLGHPGVVSTLLELGATSNCGDVLPSKQFWRVLAASRDVDLIDVLQTFYKHVRSPWFPVPCTRPLRHARECGWVRARRGRGVVSMPF